MVIHNDWAYFSMAESRLLGGHMAAARRAAGVSTVSLARRLRIPEATLDDYEAGRERLPVPLLFGAARALRVAPYQLLAGRPDRVLNPKTRTDFIDFKGLTMPLLAMMSRQTTLRRPGTVIEGVSVA